MTARPRATHPALGVAKAFQGFLPGVEPCADQPLQRRPDRRLAVSTLHHPPSGGQAWLEREEREAVAGGVLGRYRGLAEVLDHDPAALGDGFEAEAYFCLLVRPERSRPPREHEPVRRLPHPDPPDLDDLASCAAQPRGVPVQVDGGVQSSRSYPGRPMGWSR